MQQVRIHRVGGFLAGLGKIDRDAMLLSVGHEFFTREQVPLAPGCDHLDLRHEGIGAELETHLVVALARGAVGDGFRPCLSCDLDKTLRDERTRDRGAEQVLPLVDGIGPEHRKDVVTRELLAQVLDVDLFHAHGLGLCTRRRDFLALSDIRGEGDDLALIGILEPFQNDRSIQSARVGEDDLVDTVGHVRDL